MTNSFASSKHLRLIIIHGLNNNLEGFHPLSDEFLKLGYDCQLVILPGHGEDRDEARTFISAFRAFDRQLKQLVQEPYVVIAFSQGALFFQLWLETNHRPAPKAQVLLAPALLINHQSKIMNLISLLPAFAFIISQTPKKLRRYFKLHIWEYRTFFEALNKYQVLKSPFRIPTMVLVDPQDELIHAKKLEETLGALNKNHFEFHYVERPQIKAPGLGKHHVLFHPDYFEEDEWKNLLERIQTFLTKHIS